MCVRYRVWVCELRSPYCILTYVLYRGLGAENLCASDVEVKFVTCDHPAAFWHSSSSEAWGQGGWKNFYHKSSELFNGTESCDCYRYVWNLCLHFSKAYICCSCILCRTSSWLLLLLWMATSLWAWVSAKIWRIRDGEMRQYGGNRGVSAPLGEEETEEARW